MRFTTALHYSKYTYFHNLYYQLLNLFLNIYREVFSAQYCNNLHIDILRLSINMKKQINYFYFLHLNSSSVLPNATLKTMELIIGPTPKYKDTVILRI